MKAEAVVRKALHGMHQTLGPIHYYGTRYDRAALAERVDIPSFRVDPLCDPLREDPRFAAALSSRARSTRPATPRVS